jgi:hypothetical protein
MGGFWGQRPASIVARHPQEPETRRLRVRKWLLLPLLLAMVVPTVAVADDMDKYVELMRSDLRNGKTELLTEALKLNDADGKKFWPIQREYETELAKVGDQRIQLLKDYAANYDSLTATMAKSLMDRAFKIETARLTVLKKYADKISKDVSPSVAARFAQVEAIVNSLIDLKLRAETPLVP